MSGTGICGEHVTMAQVLVSTVKCLILASEGAHDDCLGFVLLYSFLHESRSAESTVASTGALRVYVQRSESEVSLSA